MSDVYISANIEMDYRLWCCAVAQYVAPRGAIGGLSAAYLHGVDLRPSMSSSAPSSSSLAAASAAGGFEPIDAVVPTAVRKAGAPQVKLVRSPLPPSHVSDTTGVRATTPIRTAFDLGRQLPLVDAVIALDTLCIRRVLRLPDLAAFAAIHTSWPGTKRLATALALAEPLSQSSAETRVRLALVDGGLPRPVAQYEARAGGRLLGRIDLAYPEWLIGIECDAEPRRSRAALTADLRRAARLTAAGWTIIQAATDTTMTAVVAQVRTHKPS